MKKMSFVIGVVACFLFFTGCGNNTDVPVEQPNPGIQQPVEDNKVEEPSEDNKVEKPVEDNKVEKPVEDNKVEEPSDVVEEPADDNVVEQPGDTKALADIMNSIVTKSGAEVNAPMMEAIPADVSLGFVGIDTDEFNKYVEESVVYESMISPAFQSICMVKINDSTKVEELKKTVLDNCNLRKWVCTSAEKAVVVNSGNYILLAMSETNMCDEIVKAFSEEFGGSVGETLSKTAE